MEINVDFKVFRKSENTNSFGLRQYFLMDKEGRAYKSHASMHYEKNVGDVIQSKRVFDDETHEEKGESFVGHEMTKRLKPDAPKDVIEEVWKL